MTEKTEKEISFGDQKYSIYNAMQCPKQIGKVNKVKFESIVDTIGNNFQSYVTGYPFSGVQGDLEEGKVHKKSGFYEGPDVSLGKNYFTRLGQNCSQDSEPSCRGKPIYTYIRNIPTGKIPLFNDVSFQGLTGCDIRGVTEGRGLLPGIFEDISDISPWALADKLGNRGNVMGERCEKKQLPVGTHIYDRKMRGKSWDFEEKCTNSLFYYKPNTVEGTVEHIPGARGPFSDVAENFMNSDITETFDQETNKNNISMSRMNVTKEAIESQKDRTSFTETKEHVLKSIETPVFVSPRRYNVISALAVLLIFILIVRVIIQWL